MKIKKIFISLITALMTGTVFSADVVNCPLKDMFASEIYALASQVAIICSDTEQEVMGKIAAKEIASECLKRGLKNAVVLTNGKPSGLDKAKLEYSDIAGDFCLNQKGFKKELQLRIDRLLAENSKLKEKEKIALRNNKADQALAARKKESDAFWESPEGKAEMAKRKMLADKSIAMYLEKKSSQPANPQDKMSILKSQLRKCGVNSETLTVTSIDQQCKRSLAQDKYEDAIAYCSINFSSCFNEI